jgi:urease beta subunit
MDDMPPQPWDVVEFVAEYSVDCVGLGGSYSVLGLHSGYNGNVTLGGSTTVTEFSMEGGTVTVPGTLSAYVANVFGGTLNVQSDASIGWGLEVRGGAAVTIQGVATLNSLWIDSSGGSVTLTSGGTVGHMQQQAGTLALVAPVTAGVFSLSGGQVTQTSSADLTVNGVYEEWSGVAFTWTGGTLNSSTNLANVTITGTETTALIAPTSGGTVNLGSNINLSGGAVATLREGTINITNDGTAFNINANSEIRADPGANKDINIEANNFGGQINLDAATSVFDAKSGRVNSTGSVKNTAGRFTLRSGALAAFTGEVDKEANGPSFRQIGGVVQLYLESALT